MKQKNSPSLVISGDISCSSARLILVTHKQHSHPSDGSHHY